MFGQIKNLDDLLSRNSFTMKDVEGVIEYLEVDPDEDEKVDLEKLEAFKAEAECYHEDTYYSEEGIIQFLIDCGEERIESCDIPEEIARHIDWDSYAREMMSDYGQFIIDSTTVYAV